MQTAFHMNLNLPPCITVAVTNISTQLGGCSHLVHEVYIAFWHILHVKSGLQNWKALCICIDYILAFASVLKQPFVLVILHKTEIFDDQDQLL